MVIAMLCWPLHKFMAGHQTLPPSTKKSVFHLQENSFKYFTLHVYPNSPYLCFQWFVIISLEITWHSLKILSCKHPNIAPPSYKPPKS